MKNIIGISLLFVAANLSAQNIPADDTTGKPAITEAGKPNGKKLEMMMDKDGGTLVSGDGNLELIFSPGALSKKTTISIQPVTNLLPNGNGAAYRLEPSGIQFQKPVQIIFHYDPEESADSAQSLMSIAMQDDKGQWYGLKKIILDTLAKTISGDIDHFSTWTTYDKLKLKTVPPTKRLKVKKTVLLGIWGVDLQPEQENPDEKMSSLRSWKPPQKGIWRVNRVIKGNTEFGTLEKGSVDEADAKWNVYTAPDNVPDRSPVTISVDLAGASYRLKGEVVKNLSLRTSILIYDNAYEVTMVSSIEGLSGGEFGNVAYKDTGSFVVLLEGKKTRIIERINKKAVAELGYEGGRCKIKPLKSAYGNIHMVGKPAITISPALGNKPANVLISFARTPVMLPLLQVSCPNRKGPPTISTNREGNAMIAGFMSAFPPIDLEFVIRDGEHVIVESPKNLREVYYKFTVKKLEDD